MSLETKIDKSKHQKVVYCEICHDKSLEKIEIRNFGSKLGIICGNCSKKFTDKEIDLMYHMFTVLGGYFGKDQKIKLMDFLKLKEIAREYVEAGKDINKIEKDILVLHKAFLNGISITQLKEGLNLIAH